MRDKKIYLFLIFSFVVYLFFRLLPIFRYGYAAFGYDFGIYRRMIEEYANHALDPAQPSFAFTVFTTPLRLLGFSLDYILVTFYILIAAGIWYLFYAVAKDYLSKRAAVIATFLFSVSLVQFEFYSWYYYRQFLALFFILLALYFVRRRSFLALAPLVAFGSIHPVSFMPFGVALVLFGLWQREERQWLWVVSFGSLGAVLFLNWQEFSGYIPLLTKPASAVSSTVQTSNTELTGQFINIWMYLCLGVPVIFCGLIGFFLYWKKQKFWSLFFITNVILFISHIVFYRRFLVFIDVALIIFAAQWLSQVYERVKDNWTGRVCAILGISLLIFYCGSFAVTRKPIISPQELLAIQQIDFVVPDNKAVMVLSPREAPWVYGFTHRPVVAPGMFEWNKWTEAEWNVFWYTKDMAKRKELLNVYSNSPLYIYVNDRHISFADIFKNDSAFTQVTEYLWSYSRGLGAVNK